jgi:ABC-type bacteriocin/lantibiotic exporter with double-glycine peptidase domain
MYTICSGCRCASSPHQIGEIIPIQQRRSGAQNAITSTLPSILTSTVTLISTLVVAISIEWRLTVLVVVVLPLFLLPARRVGAPTHLRREQLDYNADMSNIVNETLGITGALLVKTLAGSARSWTVSRGEPNLREVGCGAQWSGIGSGWPRHFGRPGHRPDYWAAAI